MKVLTVKQPWATLLFNGKDIENRTWQTKYRGELLIHASANPKLTLDKAIGTNQFFTIEQENYIKNSLVKSIREEVLPFSAIIGVVKLVDCIQDSKSIWAEKDTWHWVIEEPILFEEPILNVKGRLNLWNYEL